MFYATKPRPRIGRIAQIAVPIRALLKTIRR
jgi:hypothetical protein